VLLLFFTRSTAMTTEQFRSCIDACYACADACDHCAVSCLAEEDVGHMARCIKLDMDCAQFCRMAAAFMARASESAKLVCEDCAEICTLCAEECSRHQHDHCQACAAACRRCAEECLRMAQSPMREEALG
jgi:hypothetical protein